MTLLIFLAVLGVLVTAHELGHFSVAKLARVNSPAFRAQRGISRAATAVALTNGGPMVLGTAP